MKKLRTSKIRTRRIAENTDKLNFYLRLVTLNEKTRLKWHSKAQASRVKINEDVLYFRKILMENDLYIFDIYKQEYYKAHHPQIVFTSRDNVFVQVALKEYGAIVAFKTVKFTELYIK